MLSSDRQQRQLVARLREYLLRDRLFAKPDIDRGELLTELGTNKTCLFEAVKTPKEYIRTMQLDEARQMLDTRPGFTVETIAGEWDSTLPVPSTACSANVTI
jgi:hypothetical protein